MWVDSGQVGSGAGWVKASDKGLEGLWWFSFEQLLEILSLVSVFLGFSAELALLRSLKKKPMG